MLSSLLGCRSDNIASPDYVPSLHLGHNVQQAPAQERMQRYNAMQLRQENGKDLAAAATMLTLNNSDLTSTDEYETKNDDVGNGDIPTSMELRIPDSPPARTDIEQSSECKFLKG